MFAAKSVQLALFFQMDHGRIVVIIADSEFLPAVDAVDLFPQSFVCRIIKIKAAYSVFAFHRMWVGFRNGPQPLPDGNHVGNTDLMLPFMAIVHVLYHFLPLLSVAAV